MTTLEKWKETCRSPTGKRMIIILIATIVFTSMMIFIDINEKDGNVIQRNHYGEGEKEENVIAKVEGVKEQEEMTITVGELEYKKSEIQKILTDAAEKLDTLILGENETLDTVRKDLNLVTTIPDSSIEVAWEVSDYKLMSAQGELQSENLRAGGTTLTLSALLTYGGEEVLHEIPICVYPPLLSEDEAVMQELKEKVDEEERTSRSKREVVLPQKIGTSKVQWSREKQQRGFIILLLGTIIAGLMPLLEKQRKVQELKETRQQMMLDYPEIINQFTVYLGAGLTAKNAWLRMVSEYEKKKEERLISGNGKKNDGERQAYEEMVYTSHEMQGGITEGECYERFGKRCKLQPYTKFGALLSQNLRKGSKGLVELLSVEAANAFEERKNQAKKMGEEASTKLLAPMFMMLVAALIVVIVPAFLSIQI